MPSKEPLEPPSSSPKSKGLVFQPDYLTYGGVEHTFTGKLFIPTDEEFDRIDRLNAIKDGVKQLVATVELHEPPRVQRVVPYCHGFTNVDEPAPRVKMSAGELIRLGATKSKGR